MRIRDLNLCVLSLAALPHGVRIFRSVLRASRLGGPLPRPLPLPLRQLVEHRRQPGPGRPGQRVLHQLHRHDQIPAPGLRRRLGHLPRDLRDGHDRRPGNSGSGARRFDYWDESDNGTPGRPTGYPIPLEAKTQAKWIEGRISRKRRRGRRQAHADHRPRQRIPLRDVEHALCTSGSPTCAWEAGSGAVFSIDSNARRPDGWTSADAAGLAILPGLVRYEEVFGADPIRHASGSRFARRTAMFIGFHRAGSTSGALPMGARLRLKAAKDISGFTPYIQKIFQAMKTSASSSPTTAPTCTSRGRTTRAGTTTSSMRPSEA